MPACGCAFAWVKAMPGQGRGAAGTSRRQKKSLLVDTVINCTGPRFVWKNAGQPFWDVLFQRGLATPGPLGLGIATGPLGELIGHDGGRNASVFAVGPLRIGDLWETIAIPEIRAQAAALARHLCERLDT